MLDSKIKVCRCGNLGDLSDRLPAFRTARNREIGRNNNGKPIGPIYDYYFGHSLVERVSVNWGLSVVTAFWLKILLNSELFCIIKPGSCWQQTNGSFHWFFRLFSCLNIFYIKCFKMSMATCCHFGLSLKSEKLCVTVAFPCLLWGVDKWKTIEG